MVPNYPSAEACELRADAARRREVRLAVRVAERVRRSVADRLRDVLRTRAWIAHREERASGAPALPHRARVHPVHSLLRCELPVERESQYGMNGRDWRTMRDRWR